MVSKVTLIVPAFFARRPLCARIPRVKSRTLLLVVTLIFIAHAIFYYFALGSYAVDDAYISFRYAQNTILGYGLTFNQGERVEGFTNFLWTAALVPLEGAGADLGRLSMVFGSLFGFATLALVYRFARAFGKSTALGIIAALLLAVDGSFILWSVAGLETSLFAFMIFAGAFAYTREQASPRNNSTIWDALVDLPPSGIFFALAAMTRPEGVIVFGLTVAHQALWRIITEHRLLTGRDLRRGFGFAAVFVPYWLARWWYYSSFFPNSFYAKVSTDGPAAQILRGWSHLNQFVNVHLGPGIIIPIVIAVAAGLWQFILSDDSKQRPDGKRPEHAGPKSEFFWLSYFTLLITVYCAYIVYVGGDWSVGRFFAPLMPFVYLLIGRGLIVLHDFSFRRTAFALTRWKNEIAVILVVALALGIAFASSWNGEYGIYIRSFDAARATDARLAMGEWLKSNAPRGTWIAVDAAGQVPYVSGLPTIDMFGINDLHIGRLKVKTLGQGTPGHEKFDLGYVIARAPQYVIIYGNLLDPVTEYRRLDVNWTADAGLEKFLTIYEKR